MVSTVKYLRQVSYVSCNFSILTIMLPEIKECNTLPELKLFIRCFSQNLFKKLIKCQQVYITSFLKIHFYLFRRCHISQHIYFALQEHLGEFCILQGWKIMGKPFHANVPFLYPLKT